MYQNHNKYHQLKPTPTRYSQKLFMQLPLLNRKRDTQKLQFIYSRAIYSIDNAKSLTKKYNNSIVEHLKESFIHSFSTATVLVKEML